MLSRLPAAVLLRTLFALSACLSFNGGLLADSSENQNAVLARRSIVEVIIPKLPQNIEFSQPLPVNKLPIHIRNDQFESIGTAFFVNEKQLVSAAHVFQPFANQYHSKYFVRTIEGQVFEIHQVTKYTSHQDLIEFTLKEYPKVVYPLTLNPKFTLGDSVCAPGNALGEGIAVRCGGQIAVETKEPVNGEWKDIRFSTPVSPGNSGGPLLNRQAQVVGVITQKSITENLNIATPISEYLKLKHGLGRYFDPHFMFQEHSGETTRQVIDLQIRLPLSPENLTLSFRKGYQKSAQEIFKKHRQYHAKKLFPREKHYRAYLTDQSYSHLPVAHISRSSANKFDWHLNPGDVREVQIDRERKILLQNFKNTIFLTLDKPKDISLQEYMQDSKGMMDDIIKGLELKIKFVNEEMLIHSYGLPAKRSVLKDGLGRTWTIAEWFNHFQKIRSSLYCTPNIGKVSCMVVNHSYQYDIPSRLMMRQNLSEFITSYSGTIQDWKDFLVLDQRLLPDFFKKETRIRITDSRILIESKYFGFHLKDSIAEQDSLSVKIGMNPKELMGAEIHAFEYRYLDGEETFGHSRAVIFPPHRLLPADRISKIRELISGQSPFDGRSMIEHENLFMTFLTKPGNRGSYTLYQCYSTNARKLQSFHEGFCLFD